MSPRAHLALAWTLALALGALAAAGWLRAPASSSTPSLPDAALAGATRSADAGETAPMSVTSEPCSDAGLGASGAVLGLCLERLARAGGSITDAPRALDAADAGASPDALACLTRPDVAALARSAARAEIDRDARATREARGRAVHGALVAALGASEEDLDVMGDSVCAARALRDRTLTALEAADGSDTSTALGELRAARDAALADVEARLGPERYATFRGLGGVGLLADVLDCEGH